MTYKERLLRLQKELRELEETGAEGVKIVELDQARVGRVSRMDALQGQAMSLEAKRRRGVELKKIGAALQRLEEGEYGYCVQCGEEIATKRLELDPAASLCVACAGKSEHR